MHAVESHQTWSHKYACMPAYTMSGKVPHSRRNVLDPDCLQKHFSNESKLLCETV